MRKLAVYGKGGVGKSTIVSNLSAIYAMSGRKTLQIGCDPKADSTIALCGKESRRTVMDALRERRKVSNVSDVLLKGRLGIDCVEAGGPEPGVGCGGRGVLRMLEALEEIKLVSSGNYDVVIYDVLGDIVCGGFAAPLRLGLGEIVTIVISDEDMSVYAANNIAKMVVEYASNGIALGGLIANLKNNDADREWMEDFAGRIGTSIIGYVPRDRAFRKAMRAGMTVAEMAPDSEASASLRRIAEGIMEMRPAEIALPTPMGNEEIIDFLQSREIDDDD